VLKSNYKLILILKIKLSMFFWTGLPLRAAGLFLILQVNCNLLFLVVFVASVRSTKLIGRWVFIALCCVCVHLQQKDRGVVVILSARLCFSAFQSTSIMMA